MNLPDNASAPTDRLAMLSDARAKAAAARARLAQASTRAEKRSAAEDVEFWSNKAAMLGHPAGWAQ